MKTKITTLLLTAILLFASCSSKLKTDYDCECKELWSKIKGHEFEDFEKAWGHYVDKEENFDDMKVGYKYQISYECAGSPNCGEIWLWFDAFRMEGSADLAPMNKVHHAYCYSPGRDTQNLIK